MKQLRYIYKFIQHFLTARNTKGYGVHSPSLFQLVRLVIPDKNQYYIFPKIENIRHNLKADKRILHIEDFGTGSNRQEKVSELARKALKAPKYGRLIYRIINNCKARYVLELGTSLGLTTAYMASPDSKIRCVTMEGSAEIAAVARENLNKLQITNIEIISGNIDEKLAGVLDTFPQLDFVFIDANHRLPAVYNYFEQCVEKSHNQSVIVMDDIHWSSEMERAWDLIKSHPKVSSTVDLFQLGIVFFNPDLNKKHYKIRY